MALCEVLVMVFVCFIRLNYASLISEAFTLYRKDKLIPNFYSRLDAFSTVCCAVLCQQSSTCHSFGFQTVQRRCYLYDSFPADCGSTMEIGMVTYTPHPEDKDNVAVGKPAVISSVYDDGPYEACRAVDGNMTTFCHSKLDAASWWCLDLQQIYNFKEINLYNRPGYAGTERQLQYFTMKLSNVGQCNSNGFNSAVFCYEDNLPDVYMIYNISDCTSSQPFTSRFIYINIHNTSIYLHFMEMVVKVL